jgi:hypothetical protein
MKDLIGERFLVKKNSYIVDLANVDFITYKENENEIGTYWVKFHIGQKEARYVCYDLSSLRDIIQYWTMSKSSKARIEENKLV